MSLKPYEVVTEGRHPHTTTMLLSDEDAKRMGVFDGGSKTTVKKTAAKPTNKARTPRNKAAAKPAAKKTAAKPTAPAAPSQGVEAASDPGASE